MITISKSTRIAYDNDEELDLQYRQKPSIRSFSGNPLFRHKLINNNILDDELFHLVNHRASFKLNDFLKRGTSFTTKQLTFQKEMLAAHNGYRKKHCTPALILDDSISRSAQDFADKLIATNQFAHSNTKGLGENLWITWTSGKLSTVNGK